MSAPRDRFWLWALASAASFAALAGISGNAFWLLFAILAAVACVGEWAKANRTQRERLISAHRRSLRAAGFVLGAIGLVLAAVWLFGDVPHWVYTIGFWLFAPGFVLVRATSARRFRRQESFRDAPIDA